MRSLLILSCFLLISPRHVDARGIKHALLVGVSKYDPKQLNDLKFADRDISELSKVLIDRCGFQRKYVRLMTKDHAFTTRDARWLPESRRIRRELRLLVQRADKEDTVLIAFAGHGIQFANQSENYFCPADAVLDDKDTLIGLQSEVYQLLEKSCKARIKLLFVDACRNDPRSDTARSRRTINLQNHHRPHTTKLPTADPPFPR